MEDDALLGVIDRLCEFAHPKQHPLECVVSAKENLRV